MIIVLFAFLTNKYEKVRSVICNGSTNFVLKIRAQQDRDARHPSKSRYCMITAHFAFTSAEKGNQREPKLSMLLIFNDFHHLLRST